MSNDEINSPSHYMLFPDMEAIDVIESALTPEELKGYYKGSALKYRLRAGDKGPVEKCIGKANWYQNRLRSRFGNQAELVSDDACAEAIHAEPSTEDMTDPRNWRAGDWVVCVDEHDPRRFLSGRLYRITKTKGESVFPVVFGENESDDECAYSTLAAAEHFRFHARPDAEGWIGHDGRDESPVGDAVRVDVQTEHTGDTNRSAGNTVWSLVRRYRPHLATNQNKG